MGFVLSFGIKSEALEGDVDFEDEDVDEEDQATSTGEADDREGEQRPLLSR